MANERYLARGVLDLNFEWFTARLLQSMHSARHIEEIDAIVANDMGPVDASIGFGFAPNLIPRYCCRVGGITYAFFGGIRTPDQGQRLWAGYQNPNRLTQPYPHPGNVWMKDLGLDFYNNYVVPVWDGGPFTAVGYSAGGAILVYVYNRVNVARGNWLGMSFLSFGAPAIDAPQNLPRSSGTNEIRVFCADDPVPLVPFMESVAFGATWTMGTANVTYLNSFGQWPRGVQLGLDNSITTPVDRPQNAVVNRTASVGAWLAQADLGLITSHSLDTYIGRLNANRPINHPVPSLPAAIVANPPLTNRDVHQMQTIAVNTIINDATVRNLQPVVVPDDRLFHAARSGRLWKVLFGGVEVATSLRKKRARGLARQGNDFLRRLQRLEIVSTDDLAAQFLTYLSAASEPGSGILPTLNPGFPQPS